MRIALVACVAAFSLPAGSQPTARHPVLNHGRVAGEMSLYRRGDTVTVRYVYVDRNRGQRVEARYVLGSGTRPVQGELRPLDQSGLAGDATVRYELSGDSYLWASRGGEEQRAAAEGQLRLRTAPFSTWVAPHTRTGC
jgi:hypothetical protein